MTKSVNFSGKCFCAVICEVYSYFSMKTSILPVLTRGQTCVPLPDPSVFLLIPSAILRRSFLPLCRDLPPHRPFQRIPVSRAVRRAPRCLPMTFCLSSNLAWPRRCAAITVDGGRRDGVERGGAAAGARRRRRGSGGPAALMRAAAPG